MRSQSDVICLALRFQPIAFGISDHEQLDSQPPNTTQTLGQCGEPVLHHRRHGDRTWQRGPRADGGVSLLDDVDFDLRDAFAGDAQRFGGGSREVHNATANERAAVVDADRHRAPRVDVGDA
jgi:hypothetical protein